MLRRQPVEAPLVHLFVERFEAAGEGCRVEEGAAVTIGREFVLERLEALPLDRELDGAALVIGPRV